MKLVAVLPRFGLSALSLLVLLAAVGFAQTNDPRQESQPASPSAPASAGKGEQKQQAGDTSSSDQKHVEGATQGEKSADTETRISPQQAEELFRSVDVILKFASKDSGLPVKQEVKRRLTSRDEVTAYLEKNMKEDKDAQRLRRSELVLKKFGLLPKDFDLQSFLVSLLREQVAGYYDIKTKTVNLLDWVDVEQQKPVMAHELTHALQDHSFNLEKWMKAVDVDIDKKKQPTPEDLDKDEALVARQAVVEGQAMVVLLDYMLAPLGQNLLSSRELVHKLQEGMLVGTADSPQFANAPLYLKEALTFPYRYGVDFIADVLAARGKQAAFAGSFENPPSTTRQIMEPKTYLSGERLVPMPLPDFERAFKNYERFDLGSVGEFDVAIIIDQFAGIDVSRSLYPEWRGGYYYAARPKGDPEAPLALLYVSRWANADAAAQFAAVYAKSLTKRYVRARAVSSDQSGAVDLSQLDKLTGEHTWLTEQGPVVIDVHNDTVFVTESLDQSTTDELEADIFHPGAAKPANQ
jgi:hypothetical protein